MEMHGAESPVNRTGGYSGALARMDRGFPGCALIMVLQEGRIVCCWKLRKQAAAAVRQPAWIVAFRDLL